MILHFEAPETVEQRDSFKQAVPSEPMRRKLVRLFYPDHQRHAKELAQRSPDAREFLNWYVAKNLEPEVSFGFISRVEIAEGTNLYLVTAVMSLPEFMAEMQAEMTRRNRKDE